MLNAGQAYVAKILADLLTSTPECAALWAPHGRILREGELLRNPELGDALLRLGQDGAEPFYRGDIAAAVCDWLWARGGSLSREDLAGYRRDRARAREGGLPRPRGSHQPAAVGGRDAARVRAGAAGSRPRAADAARGGGGDGGGPVRAHARSSWKGSSEEGFLERFLATRLGSTTHISVLDAEGRACSCTCTNGEGSGVVVPGTGMHLNNVMGEEDLNPLGFHRHPAGTAHAEHDGPLGRDARRGGRAGARQRRLQPHPLGPAADDRRRRRSRHARRARRWTLRACTSRTACSTPSRESTCSELRGQDVAGGAVRRAEPVLRRGPGGAARGDGLTGAGDPRRGGVAVSA